MWVASSASLFGKGGLDRFRSCGPSSGYSFHRGVEVGAEILKTGTVGGWGGDDYEIQTRIEICRFHRSQNSTSHPIPASMATELLGGSNAELTGSFEGSD